jgi:hypothetical protein
MSFSGRKTGRAVGRVGGLPAPHPAGGRGRTHAIPAAGAALRGGNGWPGSPKLRRQRDRAPFLGDAMA